MYEPYGIHKKVWNKYKTLVIDNNYNSNKLKEEFKLDDRQIWFLFDKLLQKKYNRLYNRESIKEEELRENLYVYNDELGRGYIYKILKDGLMTVKFDNNKLLTMCSSVNMTTVYDDKKRKLTRL